MIPWMLYTFGTGVATEGTGPAWFTAESAGTGPGDEEFWSADFATEG